MDIPINFLFAFLLLSCKYFISLLYPSFINISPPPLFFPTSTIYPPFNFVFYIISIDFILFLSFKFLCYSAIHIFFFTYFILFPSSCLSSILSSPISPLLPLFLQSSHHLFLLFFLFFFNPLITYFSSSSSFSSILSSPISPLLPLLLQSSHHLFLLFFLFFFNPLITYFSSSSSFSSILSSPISPLLPLLLQSSHHLFLLFFLFFFNPLITYFFLLPLSFPAFWFEIFLKQMEHINSI